MPGQLLSTGRQKQKMVRAHRFAWRLTHGEWPSEFTPEGKKGILIHSCDVRNCVNPDHLRLGTQAENSADMVARGRASKGVFHSAAVAANAARGSANPKAKLTEEQVAQIKGEILIAPRNEHGEIRDGVYARLAEHFGITRTALMYIARGRNWPHVQPSKIEKSILPLRLAKRLSNATLTLEDAKEIHRLRALGMTTTDLAAKFKGTRSMICSVLLGKTWPDALGVVKYDPAAPLRVEHRKTGEDHHNAKLNEAAVQEIRARAASGEPWVNIVTEFNEKRGIRPPTIYDVLAGRSWRHLKE